MQQREEREEKVKRILFAAAEERRVNAQKRKENNVLSRLLLEYKGRYSILQLLPLIKRRYPPLLAVAVERVEAQKQRGELSMDKVLDFERFKASLKKEE